MDKVKRTFGGKGSWRDRLSRYVSPSFSGLQAGRPHVREPGADETDHFYSAGLLYRSGPLRLSGVHGDGAQDHQQRQAIWFQECRAQICSNF